MELNKKVLFENRYHEVMTVYVTLSIYSFFDDIYDHLIIATFTYTIIISYHQMLELTFQESTDF